MIDLLKGREAKSVSALLKRHPVIRVVVARDRSDAYAKAAATSVPRALQIADRAPHAQPSHPGGVPAEKAKGLTRGG